MKSHVLYLSYDGMLEPLGQSQVVAYLEQLAQEWSIDLISFEKPADRANVKLMAEMRERLATAGIRWTVLTYHKTPTVPATLYDIARGAATAIAIARQHNSCIVHARGYITGIMAHAVKRTTGARFVFDMRSHFPDERADAGYWPRSSRTYKSMKVVERRLLLAADTAVTLTNAGERDIRSFEFLRERCPPIKVIPTCADLARFSLEHREPVTRFTMGHAGTVGGWYLFTETLKFFGHILERVPNARFNVINRNEHETARAEIERAELAPHQVCIRSALPIEMPSLIRKMTCGAAIIQPTYGKIGSAPTRLAEYLGCGIPCVGNVGVGDMKEILEDNQVGVALKDFSDADMKNAVHQLIVLLDDPNLERRCRETAERLFSLEGGVQSYDAIYRSLTSGR